MNNIDRLRYRGPEFDPAVSNGVSVSRFEVTKDSFENWRNTVLYGRGTRPGRYSMLSVDGTLWMSDTDAECRDHSVAVWAADSYKGGTGIVNGLGLGCVIGAWLDVLDHVTVVEADARIIDTVGAWYESTYPGRITIWHGDAYTVKLPVGARWDVAWHDVWPTITSDNLPEMATLHRRYGKRVAWQESWARPLCRRMKRAGN